MRLTSAGAEGPIHPGLAESYASILLLSLLFLVLLGLSQERQKSLGRNA